MPVLKSLTSQPQETVTQAMKLTQCLHSAMRMMKINEILWIMYIFNEFLGSRQSSACLPIFKERGPFFNQSKLSGESTFS
tara:strand:- start:5453 stop:5692 length:240 start_codon:yes stop_codon:yes gene_type:complete